MTSGFDYRVTALKKFLVSVFGLGGSALLARYLGPELRAEYAVIMNSAAIAVVVLNFGVSNAYQSAYRDDGVRAAQVFVAYSLVLFVAVGGLGLIALGLLDGIYAAVLFIAGMSLLRMQLQIYGLVKSVRGAAYIAIAGSLSELLVIAVVWFTLPSALLWAIASILIKDAVVAGLSLWMVARRFQVPARSGAVLGGLVRGASAALFSGKMPLVRSWPLFILTVLIVINYKIDVLFLDFLGVDKELIGVFAIGVLVSEYLWIVSDVFKDVQVSRTARGGGARDVAAASRMAIGATVVAYAFFLVFGQMAILLMYGPEFAGSFQVAALMLLANICMIPCKILGAYYISIRRVTIYLLAMAVAVGMNVGLNLLLIPRLGTGGAIAASVVSYFLAGAALTVDFVRQNSVSLRAVLVVGRRDFEVIARGLRRTG